MWNTCVTSLWTSTIKITSTTLSNNFITALHNRRWMKMDAREASTTSPRRPRRNNENEDESTEIWSAEWQCYICGLAQKRGREDDQGEEKQKMHKADDGAEDDEMKGKAGKSGGGKGSKGGKGSNGSRPGGPCWCCGGPHFQRMCPNNKGGGKGVPYNHSLAKLEAR